MTTKRKPGARDFKPGQSGNPNGRPRLPGDVKTARMLTAIEVSRVVSRLIYSTTNDLKELLQDENTNVLEGIIARVMIEAGKHGDQTRLQFLFDRTVGKVTERIDVKMPTPTAIKHIGEAAVTVLGAKELGEDDECE